MPIHPEHVVEQLERQIREFARSRAKDVERGAETPRLAALILQKYGRGVVDAVSTIFDSPRVADPIYKAIDEETFLIDPNWKEHDRERWKWRPADIMFNSENQIENSN